MDASADRDDAALAIAGVALDRRARLQQQRLEADVAPAGRLRRHGGAERDDQLAHRYDPLLRPRFLVGSARGAHRLVAADRGDRHVPPALVARHAGVAVGLDVHDDGAAGVRLRLCERRAELVDRAGSQHARAEALRVGREVDRDRVVAPPVVDREVAVAGDPVVGAIAGAADRARERADRRVAVVLDQDDDELDALGDRRRQLAREHQVGAVADHHEHLAVRRRELGAHPARDLVAHARVAVLDVVALAVGIGRPPQLVQVAGHRAGGADDHVALAGRLVDGADHLGLARQRAVAGGVEARDLLVPRRSPRRRRAPPMPRRPGDRRAPRAARRAPAGRRPRPRRRRAWRRRRRRR